MKSPIVRLSFALLAVSACSLTDCIVPPGGYAGPSYGGGYSGGYGGSYGPSDDDGYVYEEAGEVSYLPAGAVIVVEGGERHWYYHGVCYRRGARGYVILHKKPSHHVEHHDSGYYKKVEPPKSYSYQKSQPHYEEHHEHHEVQHHEEHHEGLVLKNGHYYRKDSHGKLILVK